MIIFMPYHIAKLIGKVYSFSKYIFFFSFSTNKANPFAISIDSPSVTINVTKQREKAIF